ncbi:phosphotransferase family protein [Algicella marina]|uniref:Phosphotransferase n=1 Tax=Algicella marina TaxID=2683284 RepID=A0A6P1SWP3_9RHOB|nr:phosphotransferase family protein [Algicella marina]QHQ34858.1 phosphotransferase [Algicella marina]
MHGLSSDQVARLDRYLSRHVSEIGKPISLSKTNSGQSNPTFILQSSAGKYVLRKKPDGPLLPAAHAIEREYRVMHALADTSVNVPQMIHFCEDETIIGTSFLIMEWVDGLTLNDPRCTEQSPELTRTIYANMNAMLASLHSIDVDAVGLGDFGRAGNYFARQFSRWTQQYRATETEVIAEMEELRAWLAAATPPETERETLVHGDWRLDNLLIDARKGTVNAVVDWELSTLGHPLADLASQLMQWAMPTGEDGRGLAGVDRAQLGIHTDDEYVELYARNAGLSDTPDLDFPVAFSFFRMAAILQGVKKRALDGNASNREKALRLGTYVPLFARTALERLNAAV